MSFGRFWFHGLARTFVKTNKEARGGGGGVLPYMGYIGTCRGIGYGFLVSRSLNRVSFFTLLLLCSWCGPLIG